MTKTNQPARQLYALSLGSNQSAGRHIRPFSVLCAALVALDEGPLALLAASPVVATAPLGPSRRRFANAAALVATHMPPRELLDHLQTIETHFGRRRARRWGARSLDLDIILWSEGGWGDDQLTIPHPAYRTRSFVVQPLAAIAANWRDPMTGKTIRQLAAQTMRRKPVDRAPTRP